MIGTLCEHQPNPGESFDDEAGFIHDVVVNERGRGSGVATRLIEAAAEWVASRGMPPALCCETAEPQSSPSGVIRSGKPVKSPLPSGRNRNVTMPSSVGPNASRSKMPDSGIVRTERLRTTVSSVGDLIDQCSELSANSSNPPSGFDEARRTCRKQRTAIQMTRRTWLLRREHLQGGGYQHRNAVLLRIVFLRSSILTPASARTACDSESSTVGSKRRTRSRGLDHQKRHRGADPDRNQQRGPRR